MKNIYAYTETEHSYPGYVSINEENGVITVALRTRGGHMGGHCHMSREDFAAMCAAGTAYLGQTTTTAAPAPIIPATTAAPTTTTLAPMPVRVADTVEDIGTTAAPKGKA